jgi:hypothetical protein
MKKYSAELNGLMDGLGLSEFITDVPCSTSVSPYLNSLSGWNNGKLFKNFCYYSFDISQKL